jgi:hypothetical protein
MKMFALVDIPFENHEMNFKIPWMTKKVYSEGIYIIIHTAQIILPFTIVEIVTRIHKQK